MLTEPISNLLRALLRTSRVLLTTMCMGKRNGEVVMTRRRGITRWLNRLKGFGFIEAEEGCVEVFTHYTQPDNGAFDGLYQLDTSKSSSFSSKFSGMKLR